MVASLGPIKFHRSQAVAVKQGKMVFFGGLPSLGTEIRDGWELSSQTLLRDSQYNILPVRTYIELKPSSVGEKQSARSRNSGGHLALTEMTLGRCSLVNQPVFSMHARGRKKRSGQTRQVFEIAWNMQWNFRTNQLHARVNISA